jgi:hypothetical protein
MRRCWLVQPLQWDGGWVRVAAPAPARAATRRPDKGSSHMATNSSLRCPTCGRPPANPFRIRSSRDGRIIAGCVDAFHGGHLDGDSLAWHETSLARHWRAAKASCEAAVA